jgi:hypothetical protein
MNDPDNTNDPNSDFTCVDGECHDFKISDIHPSKRGNVYIMHLFFYCSKCLKEMANERKEARGEKEKPPVWWTSAKIQQEAKSLPMPSVNPRMRLK